MSEIVKMSLADARRRARLTQKEAAREIGISVETLGNYERGVKFPDIPKLRKIEKVYGVSYNQLIFLPEDYGYTVN